MAVRKKNRLERFFSLNQHRKRLGAAKLDSKLNDLDINKLKTAIINIDEVVYTHGADKDLSQHLSNLKTEFAGRPELLYLHAQLITFIRREYKTKTNFRIFQELWIEEEAFLLKELNTRWLVSAADTFSDHSKDPLEKAIALSVSILINTIKLHETERFLQSTHEAKDNEDCANTLRNKRVDLFDGTSAFAVGTDDTLRNLRWRMDDVCETSPTLGHILKEIFARVQSHNTVYYRFKERHTRPKTAWWD